MRGRNRVLDRLEGNRYAVVMGLDRFTEPDFASLALVVIDMQRDFMDGAICQVAGSMAIVPQIARLLTAFRETQKPIIHVVRIYRPDGTNVDRCRRAAVEGGASIVRPGEPGVEIVDGLLGHELQTNLLLSGELQEAGPSEWVMYKPRWGAFYQTPLEDHLRSLGVSTVAFAGCNFPNCPRTSIYEASERDFRIVLVEDAVSGLYERGLAELANIGVSVLSTATLAARISAP